MTKVSKTAGLIFMAAASVYYGQGVLAAPGKSASPANGGNKNPAGPTDVRLLEDLAPLLGDKTAEGAAAATDEKPAAPAADQKPASPGKAPVNADSPRGEGRSVSKSEVNVTDEGTVEIHVNDASLVEVLRMLSLQSQRNIICSKEVRGTVTANLYNVTIRDALEAVLHMNGYAYREKGNFIHVYTVKELQAIEDAERKTTTEVIRLYYTPAANAMNMVKPVLSTSGQVAATTASVSGISAGGGDAGGGSHSTEDMLVITDYPDVLDRVRKILKEVDKRPQQVLVEAVILRAALNEDNALGVDFNVLAGVRFTDFLSNNGQITNGSIGADQPNNSSVGSIGTGNSFTSTIPGGLKVGFVSDNVSMFVSALEGVTDTVVMANPKVLALNKQKGEVIVGRKDGYITTTVTESATVQTVEFLDTGTRLIFRPFIGDDGYVRMELHPEDSSGGLTGANLPFKITTEMTSNIMVKDGHTVVIGGLFRESSDSSRSQVPFLGNLPLAGPLFRQQRDRTVREEIIILLTPHVIKDDSVYAKQSEEEVKRVEQLRVGVRKGMMPWGRERLAESHYEKALEELKSAKPNNQKVLWHLDSAINLNPKFLEAQDLKQRITGKEVTAVDSSSIRTFVKKAILADRTPVLTPAAPPTKVEDPRSDKPGASQADASSQDTPQEGEWEEELARPDLDEIEYFEPDADQVVRSGEAGAAKPGADTAAKPVTGTETAFHPVPPATTQPLAKGSEKPAAKSEQAATTDAKKESDTPRVTVTELPIEEVKSDAPTPDENK